MTVRRVRCLQDRASTTPMIAAVATLDNLYVGIVTLILTGEAYLFVTSQFDSWLPVIVTAAASLVASPSCGAGAKASRRSAGSR